jgi:hypothetical protein
LIQEDLTAESLADLALGLLRDGSLREDMRRELAAVAAKLAGPEDPMEVAATIVEERWKEEMVHA